MKSIGISLALAALLGSMQAGAAVLPEAEQGIRIPLAVKPSTRPMTVAYVPEHQRYYIADGGLGPVPGDMENMTSKSQLHAYDSEGHYLQSALPGYNNRSMYYNPITYRLETVTYNVSSDAGFAPDTGIFALELEDNGDLKTTSKDISGYNPAFGDAATMPSYNYDAKVYYAKQEHSNKVFVVDLSKREKVGEIALDLKAAGANTDDIHEHYIAYTGIKGEELAILDIDHKAVLVFDLEGRFAGKSALPKSLKLRAQNHYTGTGYTHGMLFLLHEPEGEFGTYYGFKVLELAQ